MKAALEKHGIYLIYAAVLALAIWFSMVMTRWQARVQAEEFRKAISIQPK